MIEQADAQLQSWVSEVLGNVVVSLDPPSLMAQQTGINLYLLELVETPPLRGRIPPPAQLSLRYLVTVWEEEPAANHNLLGRLVFAALQQPEMDVELQPLAGDLWLALGVAPRPAFVIKVLLTMPRPEQPVPPVLQPLVIEQATLTTLRGRVTAPNDTPLANALVSVPAFDRRTRTDHDGRFELNGIPQRESYQLEINARARIQLMEVDHPTDETGILITFDPLAES